MGSKTRRTPTTSRQIAFLRAINVGGHVVKMDRLREVFAELGLANVQTFIASGNVIFDTDERDTAALEQRIAMQLERRLGYPVATFIRSPADLAVIAAHTAFPSPVDETASLYIGFLGARPAAEAESALMAFRNETDDFHVHGREVYWLCRTRYNDSKFSGSRLERCLGMPATMRNITSVQRLLEQHGG